MYLINGLSVYDIHAIMGMVNRHQVGNAGKGQFLCIIVTSLYEARVVQKLMTTADSLLHADIISD